MPLTADRPRSKLSKRYVSWLKRSRSSKNYFSFFRPYFRIMTRLDALFFQDLWNLFALPRIKTIKIDGKRYFLCTTKFLLHSASRWKIKEQKARFQSLEKKGFIQKIRAGCPPLRWVRINIRKIEEALDAAQLVPNGTKRLDPKTALQTAPNGTPKNKEGKNKESSLKGSEFPLSRDSHQPSSNGHHLNGTSVKNGFHSLSVKKKAPRFTSRELDIPRRLEHVYRKKTGNRIGIKAMPFASFLASFSKQINGGMEKVEEFVTALEQGKADYRIRNAKHFEQCFLQWIDISSKVEWVKVDNQWGILFRKKTKPTAWELENESWFPLSPSGEFIQGKERKRIIEGGQ